MPTYTYTLNNNYKLPDKSHTLSDDVVALSENFVLIDSHIHDLNTQVATINTLLSVAALPSGDLSNPQVLYHDGVSTVWGDLPDYSQTYATVSGLQDVKDDVTAQGSALVNLSNTVAQLPDEAPENGKAYIRKDGTWEEISEDDLNGSQLAMPVGSLAYWPLSTPPAGWLEADGSEIDQALYPDLHNVYSGVGAPVPVFSNITPTFTLEGSWINGIAIVGAGLGNDDRYITFHNSAFVGNSREYDNKYTTIAGCTIQFSTPNENNPNGNYYTVIAGDESAMRAAFAAAQQTFDLYDTVDGAQYDHSKAYLPDLRGEFIRGWDNGRGVDAGRLLGSWQQGSLIAGNENDDAAVWAISGTENRKSDLGWDCYWTDQAGFAASYPALYTSRKLTNWAGQTGYNGGNGSLPWRGSGVTRPRNVAWMPIIKAFAAPINQGAIDLTTVVNRISQISNPNLFINGCFSVWQRGEDFTSNYIYTADRWYAFGFSHVNKMGGANGRTVLPDGSKQHSLYAKVKNGVAGGSAIQYKLEAPQFLSGQTVTVSYYVHSSVAFAFTLNREFDGSWDNKGEFQHNGGGWQKVEVTFDIEDLPNTTPHYLFQFQFINAPDGTDLHFATFKLELGSSATPFIPDDPTVNLAKCQRYYQQYPILNYRVSGSTSNAAIELLLPVVMRVSPTLAYDGSDIRVDGGGADKERIWLYSYANGSRYAYLRNLRLDAEL